MKEKSFNAVKFFKRTILKRFLIDPDIYHITLFLQPLLSQFKYQLVVSRTFYTALFVARFTKAFADCFADKTLCLFEQNVKFKINRVLFGGS